MTKNLLLYWALALAFPGTVPLKILAATIPPDYPRVVVTNSAAAAPGNVIGTLGAGDDGTKTYYVILDNTGTNLLYGSTSNTLLRFVTPQGFLTAADTSAWRFKDEQVQIVD